MILHISSGGRWFRHLAFHNYAYLATIYTCGMRIYEALALHDAKRMIIHVHRGKGAKDRYVPLLSETLWLLRLYWTTHRNPVLIFPALGRCPYPAPLLCRSSSIACIPA